MLPFQAFTLKAYNKCILYDTHNHTSCSSFITKAYQEKKAFYCKTPFFISCPTLPADFLQTKCLVWKQRLCVKVIRMFFRFSVSSEERLKVHQSAVNYLGMACYNKGQNPTNNLSFTSLAGKT